MSDSIIPQHQLGGCGFKIYSKIPLISLYKVGSNGYFIFLQSPNTSNVQMTSNKTCTITFVEDANVPNNGDGNGDGIKDNQQNNVVSLPELVASDYLTLEVKPTCSIDDVYANKPENQGNYDTAYEFPQDVMYFDFW
jgi:hypothetical protein